MAEIKFHGFSDYHSRNLCSVTFDNKFDKGKFESNFNLEYRNHQVQAESNSPDSLIVNIVYIQGVRDELIQGFIESLL